MKRIFRLIAWGVVGVVILAAATQARADLIGMYPDDQTFHPVFIFFLLMLLGYSLGLFLLNLGIEMIAYKFGFGILIARNGIWKWLVLVNFLTFTPLQGMTWAGIVELFSSSEWWQVVITLIAELLVIMVEWLILRRSRGFMVETRRLKKHALMVVALANLSSLAFGSLLVASFWLLRLGGSL